MTNIPSEAVMTETPAPADAIPLPLSGVAEHGRA